MCSVVTVGTPELKVGDLIQWGGIKRRVLEVTDTGRPAVFGSGTEWRVLMAGVEPSGLPAADLSAPSSQSWTRI